MEITPDKNQKGNTHHLELMGWTSHFQIQLEESSKRDLIPARVIGVRKNRFFTSNGKSEWFATLAGRLKHDAEGMYPVTGDWVLMTDEAIYRVLERKKALSRSERGAAICSWRRWK